MNSYKLQFLARKSRNVFSPVSHIVYLLFVFFLTIDKNKLVFMETSALHSTNVETAFFNISVGKEECDEHY